MQGLLNDWRRSNYAKDTTPEIAGEDVTIMGWVHEIRDLGGIIFVIIRDVTGRIQITAPSKKVDAEILEELRAFRKESVVAVKGTVQEAGKAPNGVEIIPKEIKILNLSNQPLPMDPTEKVKAEIDTRLDSRFLDLRKENVSAIFKIKGQMFHTIRDFFYENGFYEINTPKLVASATEGGTELFPITYFEKEAFIGQSHQLYKQMMMGSGMDKVFEIGQIFRAEEHDTLRHLNEAVSIDAEASFMDDEDMMKVLNDMLVNFAKQYGKENAEKALKKAKEQSEKEIERAKKEAERIVENARRAGNSLLLEIEQLKKEQAKEKNLQEIARKAKQAMGRQLDKMDEIANGLSDDGGDYTLPRPLKIGDRVFVKSLGGEAEVVSVDEK